MHGPDPAPRAEDAGDAASAARSLTLAIVVAVLVATAVGNLALFRSQEGELADPHRAWVSNDSDRLLHLTREHGRNVGSRFLLYVWLGDRLTDATVVLAPGHPLVEEALVGLGRVEIETATYDGHLDDDLAASLAEDAVQHGWFSRHRFSVDSSEQRFGVAPAFRRGDHAVVIAGTTREAEISDEPIRLLTYWTEELVLLVDERLAGEHGLPGALP